MPKIARLAVELTASAGVFSSVMGQAGKTLGGFAKSAAGVAGIVGGLGAVFGGFDAIEGFTDKLIENTKASLENIDATSKLADSLGATTQGLGGIQYAGKLAGESTEDVDNAMRKMQKSLGGASDEGADTGAVLRSLGLDAKQLAGLPLDQSFTQIAQAISGIANPTARAQAEIALFGKEGQKLDPLLRKGAEGIKEASDEAAKLGLTFNRVDGAKVEQANEAMIRMGAVFTGITNQIAIGLSPYIQALGDEFTEVATKGGGIGQYVIPAIEWIAKAIATTADYLELIPAGFHLWRAGALESISGILKSIDSLGGGLVKLMNLLPGVHLQWTDTFQFLEQGLDQVAADEADKYNQAMARFSSGANTAAVTKYFDGIKAKSTAAAEATAANAGKMQGAFDSLDGKNLEKITQQLADIAKETKQFGLNDSQKKLADLKADGATDDQVAKAKSLLALKDQLEQISKIQTDAPLTDYAAKMEQLQKLYGQGKIAADQFMALRDTAQKTLNESMTKSAEEITKGVQTPLQKYREQLEKLAELLKRGLITKGVFDKAQQQALGTLDSAEAKGDKQSPALLQAGSAAALEFAYNNSRGNTSLNKDQVAKEQLKAQQDGNEILTQMQRDTHDMVMGNTQQFETLDLT